MVTAPVDGPAYLARTHSCPDCRGRSRLAVRWSPREGREMVWCPRCRRTEGFIRRESVTEIWRRDPAAVPTPIANSLAKKYGGEPMTTTALATLGEAGLIKRMEDARWTKALSVQDKKDLACLAIDYNLDPTQGELIIYEGQPYITLAGYIRTAHNTSLFEGMEDRPMTAEEREAYGIVQPVGWIAKVYRKGFRVPITGTGSADPEHPWRSDDSKGKAGNFIERVRPQWMARARAIRQAMKAAFPNESPFARFEAAEERGIDPETGVIEGRTTLIQSTAAPADGIPDFGPPDAAAPTVPSELTASPPGEVHEEAAMIEDAKRRVLTLAEKCNWKPKDNYALFKQHFFENTKPRVEFDLAPLDLLNEWADRLAKALSRAAAAK